MLTFGVTDRDSVVCIATCYGLDGPGIESRWGEVFHTPSRPALGLIQPLVQWLLANLIFIGPCIVIYSYSTTNKMHLLSQIIYSCKTLYMFRTVFPSIIRSSNCVYSNGICQTAAATCCYRG